MRVLHTVASLASRLGGPSRSIPALVRALNTRGIVAATWTADQSRSPECPHQGGEFLKVIERYAPDVIHDHGVWLPNNWQVARACNRMKIPRVVSPRGMLMPWALNYQRWKKRVAWWAYQRRDFLSATAVHATGAPEADQLRALGFQGLVILAPNGVELPEQGEPAFTSVKPRRALFLSRIHPKKGLSMLIDAWSAVAPTDWVLEIVGPDESTYRAELERKVRDLRLEGHCTFRGEVGDVEKWELLRQAQLFILPSFSENFGIVVAEALAAGTPVVTTTETPWLQLNSRRSGWCVRPDEESLRVALIEATSCSDGELRQMGHRGRQWVIEEFSWGSIGATVSEGYRKILKG